MAQFHASLSDVVPAIEAADQLRAFLTGAVSGEWRGIEVEPELHLASGWVLTFFNDCGSLDYLDRVVAPDGRTQDSWSGEGENWYDPISELTQEEYKNLEAQMVAAARRL